MSDICTITISAPARGLTPGISAAFTPASVAVTHSWGLQPAIALVEWVSQSMPATLVAGSTERIDLNGYTRGQKLWQCLVDISEKLGLVFTLLGGPYTLYWDLKGTGALPGFPSHSDVRRSGSALSAYPSSTSPAPATLRS
jgi:hypothetical protein